MPKIPAAAIEAALPQAAEPKKPDWVWIAIPSRDITDYPFDGVCVNAYHYGPISAANRRCDCGDFPHCQETGMHKIPALFAPEVSNRLRVFQEQSIKLFSARVNIKALQETVFGLSGGGVFDGKDFDARVQER